MIEKAYAKINLGLNVLDKREDSYHNLETLMLPLILHDTLEINILPNKESDDFVTCDEYSLKITKYNLCHKAIDVCREKYEFKEKFDIEIHKSIFVQSGLGGGSADAAATIRGILKLLKIKASDKELKELAIKVGSDVPFSIFNKPAFVTSIGNDLEFFSHNRKDYVVIVKPRTGLSTKEVFEHGDNFKYKYHNLNIIKEQFINDNAISYSEPINNLEIPAFALLPELYDLKEKLINEGFDFVSMSGAGSSIFCLTKDKKLAKKMEAKYFKLGYEVELTNFLI